MAFPQKLKQRLQENKVVPFVGAGVSMAVHKCGTTEPLFPSWKQLLLRAADRLEAEQISGAKLIRELLADDRPDYLYAAQRAMQGLNSILYDVLHEQFDKKSDEAEANSLDLARAIWGIGNLIITTNYDRVLQWASAQSNDLSSWDIESPIEQKNLLQNNLPRPVVWHLHGKIDNAANLILTPDGYSRLYPENGNTEQRYNAALTTLRTLLVSHTFLFIGFSLDDEHFGLHLRGVNELFAGATGPHYALVREKNLEQFRALNLPNVTPLPFADFGDPLLQCVRELADITQENKTVSVVSSEPITSTIDFSAITPADFSSEKTVFYVPFARKGDQVLGRDQAMKDVRQQLLTGRRTSIGQTASFQGLGGLGKTQLAIEYAYEHRDKYPNGVIWISADQEIDSQLISIAEDARWIAPQSEHKDKLAIALYRLRSYSGCLIIFDNVESQARLCTKNE